MVDIIGVTFIDSSLSNSYICIEKSDTAVDVVFVRNIAANTVLLQNCSVEFATVQ